MTRTVYTLLIGIDDYQGAPLKGCVNDIQMFDAFIEERLAGEKFDLKPLVLTNENATRRRVIDGFRQHLTKAGRDDVAVIYFSGHGSCETAPPEFWHSEPDRLLETLVCHDSRSEGGRDLADKELAQLIYEVSQGDPHIVLIMDCCHSGSATRGADEVGVRRAKARMRPRDLASYYINPEANLITVEDGKAYVRTGRYIVLSACEDDEEAREAEVDGRCRGTFSHALLESLKRHGEGVTYRDIFKRVSALVRVRAKAQTPAIESFEVDPDQPFLGGAVGLREPYFTATRDYEGYWYIDGGEIHGITEPKDDETTHLALFPIDAHVSDLRNRANALGEAKVVEQEPTRSKIALDFVPTRDQTFKAVVTATPLPPIGVELEGDADELALLRIELERRDPILVSEQVEGSALTVSAESDGFWIHQTSQKRSIALPVSGKDQGAAALAVDRLEHIARWTQTAKLFNPTSGLPADAVLLEILDGESKVANLPNGQLRLNYELVEGKWKAPSFRIRLKNTTDQRLYCALVNVSEDFSVYTNLLPPRHGQWLAPKGELGSEAWAKVPKKNKWVEQIYAHVQPELADAGWTEVRDLLKLIVSTDECDVSQLQQDALPVVKREGARDRNAPYIKNALDRLMSRVHTRDLSAYAEEEDENIPDWATWELSIVTYRPRESVELTPGAASDVEDLGNGIRVRRHSALHANVRLASMEVGSPSRGTSGPARRSGISPLLLDHPELFKPLRPTTTRSAESGLSILELLKVKNHADVTPDEPFRLTVDGTLNDGEYVVPLAREGDLFIPVGFGRRNGSESSFEIEIDTLPEPDLKKEEETRSITGSIRIYLEKVVVKGLGREFRYPLLAAVDPSPDGLERTGNAEDVRARVKDKDTNRIVLFVHGIIGDTNGMADSAFRPPDGVAPLANNYDLVLTYDYESLSTPIEELALTLKTRLDEVGLGPNHGKTLHIVAHSMGGLVSRWFIEVLGGHEVVERLVMLGTPNGGVPWPKLKSWATFAFGLALNGLAPVAWPAKVIGTLVAASNKIDVTLKQMAPDDKVVKTLAATLDPKVPYYIVAGNTGIIVATEGGGDEKSRLLGRLVQRLMPLGYGVASQVFRAPNDVVVAVDSIKRVPAGRAVAEDAACDHMTYFVTVVGQRALASALK